MLRVNIFAVMLAIVLLVSTGTAADMVNSKVIKAGSALGGAVTVPPNTLKIADRTAMTIQDGQTFTAGNGLLGRTSPTGETLKSVPIPITKVAGIAPFTAGTLIIGNAQDNTVYKFDIATSKIDKLIDLKQVDMTSNLAANVLMSGELASIASDGANIFVGIRAGYSSSIFKIDPNTLKVLAQAWTPGPNPTAMAYDRGNLFVVDGDNAQIRRYDPEMKLSLAAVAIPDSSLSEIAIKDGGLEMLGSSAGQVKMVPLDSKILTASKSIAAISTATIDRGIIDSGMVLATKKVAVLICGDVAESGYDEFWNDICWMYKTLKNLGYTKDNIYVLYGDGADYMSSNPAYQSTETVTDFSATIANVNKVFEGLKNGNPTSGIKKMNSGDTLFVWTFDHGAGGDPAYLCLRDGSMSETDFASKLNAVPLSKRAIYMQQCRSGGFIDALRSSKTFISTACRSDQNAQRADTENEVYGGRTYHHGEYNYYIISSIAGRTPTGAAVNPDTNGDGKVSAREVHDWEVSHENQPETPQFDGGDGVGVSFILR